MMNMQQIDQTIFEAEWRRLQERFGAEGGQEWVKRELEKSRLSDSNFSIGGGSWAGFALDLPSGLTTMTTFGSSEHQGAFLELVARIDVTLQSENFEGDSAHEAYRRVAKFRLAVIPGYETPWAVRYDRTRGRNQLPEALHEWFLRERVALPLFSLYVATPMPQRLRIMTEMQ